MQKTILLLCLTLFFGNWLEASSQTKSYKKYQKFILKAEAKATTPARNVMQTIRRMVENRVVIRGACWDYLNRAFTKAGYPKGKRAVVHKGRKSGPYVKSSKIRIGDWLYYINHSYHNIEHSGMFIGWINYAKRLGLIMSYAGEGRAEPARYKIYDLTHVYNIMRAK
ncbi:MAG: hypothetical protein HF962_05225 [Sulfurovum sp.]|nr:hypothetical protein [Sulfurovum sp.]